MLKYCKHLAAAFVACLVLVLLAQPAEAAGGTYGAYTYELKGNGTAVITKFDWSKHDGGDVYVPRSIDGYQVTEIGKLAFTQSTGELTLRTSYDVKKYVAGHGAAVAIILPDTITVIAEKAFFATKITACDIPASVQIIGAGAFAGCSNIRQFSVNSRNTTFAVIDGVLFNKVKKELVAFPLGRPTRVYQIPEGILSVGDYAFYAVADAAIYGASSVKHIGAYAFAYCNDLCTSRDRVVMSPNTIGSYAFFRCDFDAYDYAGTVLDLSNLTELGEGAFMENYILFPNTFIGFSSSHVTSIPAYAFMGTYCWPQMPDSVTVIGSYAYAESPNGFADEKTIMIPAGVVTIEDHAFYNSYFSISFAPNSRLTSIGAEAFSDIKLGSREQELTLPSSVRSLGTRAFYGSLSLLVVPESVTEIGDDVINRTTTVLQVTPGSYADIWASENGIPMQVDDTSWLFE